MKRSAASMKARSRVKYDSESESEHDSNGDSDGSSSAGEFSDDQGPEEEENGDGDGSDFSEQDDGDNYDESEEVPEQSESNIPLYKRLAEQTTEEAITAVARERVKRRRIRDGAKGQWVLYNIYTILMFNGFT